MNEQDEYFMSLAIEEGSLALKKDMLPVGAVAVLKGRPIAHGRKIGYLHAHLDHAERNICEQILWSKNEKNANGVTIYTNLEPCLMCLGLMLNIRVSRIVYSLEDPYGGGVCILNQDSLPIRHIDNHPFITAGILRDQSLLLFKEFFINTKKDFWRDKKNPLVNLCFS